MTQALLDIAEERQQLKLRQQVLRTRATRLNKILEDIKQLKLPLK